MVIHAINVAVIRNGVVDMVYTFLPDDVQAAEAKFVEICTLTAKHHKQDISAADLDAALDDGHMEIGDGSVCLSHSMPENDGAVGRERLFATLTNEGTAMHEIVLTQAEYNDPQTRAKAEAQASRIPDCSIPVQWADVTENDAFYN